MSDEPRDPDEPRDLLDEASREWRAGGGAAIRAWWHAMPWDDREQATNEIYGFIDAVRAATTPRVTNAASVTDGVATRPRPQPDNASVCPDCGGPKTANAVRCKNCSRKFKAARKKDAQMLEFHRGGVLFRDLAEHFRIPLEEADAAVGRALRREQTESGG